MSNLINEIDARTRLAGANQMELLLFKLGTNEIYGINVFKVREVMKLPALTQIPEADSRIVGMANIRGIMVPVVGLRRSLGLGTETDGAGNSHPYLIVSEYNASLQGFLVSGVDRIIRFSWSAIKTPPTIVRENNKGAVTAVTMLDNGRMVLILDVEKVLHDICPRSDDEVFSGMVMSPALKSKCVMFADDSSVARTQIRKALDRLEMSYLMATTGGEAWTKLLALAEQATVEGKPRVDQIHCVLSDIEMPDMDGFTLTKHIRADPRLAHLPVILHSSLTGTCNMEKGKTVGASDYITKFDAKLLGEKLSFHLNSVGEQQSKAA
ncbi:MAG: chemotaxis signal transducer CheV [Nitrospira sp. OLB3]|nr:MAG: chemotaxis signal transducer CheV [Nitrospira sp. OLB3]RIK56484.1 MAG: fused signal transduction protein/response regulator [Nitrospira sp.]